MRFQKLLAALIGTSILALASAGALAAPIVSVDADPGTAGIQSSVTVLQGTSFQVDIVISGVDAAMPLNAFDFDLFFDPGQFRIYQDTSAVLANDNIASQSDLELLLRRDLVETPAT